MKISNDKKISTRIRTFSTAIFSFIDDLWKIWRWLLACFISINLSYENDRYQAIHLAYVFFALFVLSLTTKALPVFTYLVLGVVPTYNRFDLAFRIVLLALSILLCLYVSYFVFEYLDTIAF